MRSLVVGIGHPFRGDDAVGPRLAAALAGTVAAEIIAHHGEGTDLMERWQGFERVIVVDAMVSGAPIGTIRVWDAVAGSLPATLFPKGSHLFGLVEAIEMARLLGRLPPALSVIGVEGVRFAMGEALSAEVEQAIAGLSETIGTLLP